MVALVCCVDRYAHDRLQLIFVDAPAVSQSMAGSMAQGVRMAKPAIAPGTLTSRGKHLGEGVASRRTTAPADEQRGPGLQ
jgi:hypothetical protein